MKTPYRFALLSILGGLAAIYITMIGGRTEAIWAAILAGICALVALCYPSKKDDQ